MSSESYPLSKELGHFIDHCNWKIKKLRKELSEVPPWYEGERLRLEGKIFGQERKLITFTRAQAVVKHAEQK